VRLIGERTFKALAIATALSVGTFAAGIYGLMRYLGVDDVSAR
jgi:hypothetical protein